MNTIGASYAQALYDLAKDEEQETQILEQMQALDAAFSQEPAFLRLLSVPNLSKEERCGIIDSSFQDKVHPYLLNVMKILSEKGYARQFSACCKAYRELYYTDHGILCVLAVSAVALSLQQSEKLTQKLETITGKKVLLENRVDPQCLGGVRLDYDGKRLDGTVKNRLDSIAGLLKNTVL